jgi:hypothetical protein
MTSRSEQMMAAEFAALAEMPSDDAIPPLDRAVVDEKVLSPHQLEWRRTGVVVLRGFIPPSLVDEYRASREGRLPDQMGYPTSLAYMQIPEIRAIALYQPLAEIMTSLLGEPLAMHFDLTQWVSTERDWHQDDYLNPPEINSHYMAVWFALDAIDDDCGPFEYVPGSHRWPVVRGHLVRSLMPEEDRDSPNWPKLSEPYVVDAYERQLEASGLRVERFLADKGDVLIWHGRLLHRGTLARIPGKPRRSLIAHYTAVSKTDPGLHEIRYSDSGVPWIYHRYAELFDW